MLWRSRNRVVLIVSNTTPTPGLSPSFLHQKGIRLVASTRDDRAMKMARRGRPDLIIQDVCDEDGPGLELSQQLKSTEATRDVPLIVIAADDRLDAAKACGAEVVLRKPLVQGEYFEAVRKFIPLPRRRGLRHPVNLRFTYRSNGREHQAFSRNLSLYGAFLTTDHVPPRGSHIDVRFQIPGDWYEIRCGAVVRRATSHRPGSHQVSGFAVEFEGISERDLERLEEFIRPHLRRPFFR